MTSNKTYHFQTTANYHRFIKVWTSIADLPTSKKFSKLFFLKKVWLRNNLPTYDFDICPNFHSFFFMISLLSSWKCNGLIFFFSSSLESIHQGFRSSLGMINNNPMTALDLFKRERQMEILVHEAFQFLVKYCKKKNITLKSTQRSRKNLTVLQEFVDLTINRL